MKKKQQDQIPSRRKQLPPPHKYLEDKYGRVAAERMVDFPSLFHVENFEYDGLVVFSKKGYALWTILEFQCWTPDPGIGTFTCSDGMTRYIPACCLNPLYYIELPSEPKLQPLEGNGVLIGTPSNSL